METQTSQNHLINVTSLIRKITLSPIRPVFSPVKVFPYIEAYQAKNLISPTQNSISKILFKMHTKLKKREPPHVHSITLKYQNTNSFIESARKELANSDEKHKIKQKNNHLRSCSEANKHQKTGKSTLENLIILPVPKLQKNIKIRSPRKDSLAECNIDFRKIDIPYVQNYFKSGNDVSEVKDASNNT